MRRRINNLLKGQKGVGLLEVLFAVAILGVIGVGFMQGLATTSEGADAHEKRVTASSLAQSQVEYIKSSAYLVDGNYSVAVSSHGYSIDIETVNIDKDGLEVEVETGKQKVTVKVYHQEDFVLDMTTLKVNW